MEQKKIGNIKIEIFETKEDIGARVASLLSKELRYNNSDGVKTVWGWAAGESPRETYKELMRMHRQENLDFSSLESFMGDEYYGIGPEDSRSFNSYMHQNLLDHINSKKRNTHFLYGDIDWKDTKDYCKNYELSLKKSRGIKTQLLGIGLNGHILFNEPYSALDSRTRVVKLDEMTRESSASVFDGLGNVPAEGITMGVANIMEADKVYLIAYGQKKADPIERSVKGKVTGMLTAAYLQWHRDATFFLDKDAASRL